MSTHRPPTNDNYIPHPDYTIIPVSIDLQDIEHDFWVGQTTVKARFINFTPTEVRDWFGGNMKVSLLIEPNE